jgi:hypothetical protein
MHDYTHTVNDVSAYDCSHIAAKRSIKQFDGKLLLEMNDILQRYIGKDISESFATSIFKIITIILDSHGYKQKLIK